MTIGGTAGPDQLEKKLQNKGNQTGFYTPGDVLVEATVAPEQYL